MTIKRRLFMKGSLMGGLAGAAAATGLLTPQQVYAAWPSKGFEAGAAGDAVSAVFGSDAAEESADIAIKAPDIAENGAVVPVSVKTTLADVESIAIVAEKNSSPLTAVFNLGKRTLPQVSTRIKMGKTSNVIVYVKAGGKLYSAQKEVKVTIGGCGG